jgi:hypothetical protein
MLDVYSTHPNYQILDFANRSRRCFIFFSSHDLYYPNTSSAFRLAVVDANRFEWRRNIPRCAQKVIFLRDVRKQWYLEGISSGLNTIERVADFLDAETGGCEVVCVGSSAGGYAAALFGCLLNASCVFTFSGQYSLRCVLSDDQERLLNPTVTKYRDSPAHTKYYDIAGLVAESATPVFYFYPAKCEDDICQSKLVAGISSVYPFAFDSSHHGATCLPQNFVYLFSRSLEAMTDLSSRCKGRLLSPLEFSNLCCGRALTWKFRAESLAKRFVKTRRAAVVAGDVPTA